MSEEKQPIVLIVDDDPHVLSALRRALRREKVEIQTARNAQEALEFLGKGEAALVVSDHRMPGTSGLDLLKTIRAQWPGTRRILLSGWTDEISPAELKSADLYAVLSKPWEDKELRVAIRRAASRA